MKNLIIFFIISAKDVHWQLTRLNTNKSENAGEILPKILASIAFFLATKLAKLYNASNCQNFGGVEIIRYLPKLKER